MVNDQFPLQRCHSAAPYTQLWPGEDADGNMPPSIIFMKYCQQQRKREFHILKLSSVYLPKIATLSKITEVTTAA